jgi:hypothetical protein
VGIGGELAAADLPSAMVESLILCGRFELWVENFGGKMP